MSDQYHLDREMTKQELQIENRYLRNQFKRLRDLFTDLDLSKTHEVAERMLCEINRIMREAPTDDSALVKRFVERAP